MSAAVEFDPGEREGDDAVDLQSYDCAGEGALDVAAEYTLVAEKALLSRLPVVASVMTESIPPNPSADSQLSALDVLPAPVSRLGCAGMLICASGTGLSAGEGGFDIVNGVIANAGDLCTPDWRFRGRASES